MIHCQQRETVADGTFGILFHQPAPTGCFGFPHSRDAAPIPGSVIDRTISATCSQHRNGYEVLCKWPWTTRCLLTCPFCSWDASVQHDAITTAKTWIKVKAWLSARPATTTDESWKAFYTYISTHSNWDGLGSQTESLLPAPPEHPSVTLITISAITRSSASDVGIGMLIQGNRRLPSGTRSLASGSHWLLLGESKRQDHPAASVGWIAQETSMDRSTYWEQTLQSYLEAALDRFRGQHYGFIFQNHPDHCLVGAGIIC